jgi:hypothetical protein
VSHFGYRAIVAMMRREAGTIFKPAHDLTRIVPMKVLVAVLVGLAVLATAWEASAAQKRHHKASMARRGADTQAKQRDPNAYGWYPHDSNQLAVGSQIWWEQMDREGRLRGEPN